MPDIASWQRAYADRLTVAVVARGDIDVNRKKAETNGVSTVLVQSDKEVSEAYNATATPTGVLVLPGGTIGKASALGADAIRHLVTQATAPPPTAAGDDPPLERMRQRLRCRPGWRTGRWPISGEKTLAFWNHPCGYCTRMLPHLKEWEANPPEGAPRLVVISRG